MNAAAEADGPCRDGDDAVPAGAGDPVAPGAVVRMMNIINKKGLHARASARFVQTVEQFDAEVRVSRCGEAVGGDSIMGLMMLSAGPGTSITVTAKGAQATEVLDALAALVASRFGEED
jgi:phosphocarrier protein